VGVRDALAPFGVLAVEAEEILSFVSGLPSCAST
jgi:hypothetical protein